MATQTQTEGVAGRTKATLVASAKFERIETISAADVFVTGSAWNPRRAGSKGFIIETAGTTVITPASGDTVAASALNTKELYEIGVSRVSGSGKVHVLYGNE